MSELTAREKTLAACQMASAYVASGRSFPSFEQLAETAIGMVEYIESKIDEDEAKREGETKKVTAFVRRIPP